MLVKELIERLEAFPQDSYVYINYEQNIEDYFLVVQSDTDNILLVPLAKYNELEDTQEFSFIR